jgi:drug/metabolite transporter (DMT)-like permease
VNATIHAGAWGVGTQALLTIGLEKAAAAQAMTMSYTSIVWAELAGVIIFKEYPAILPLLGIALVIAGTLYCGAAAKPAKCKHCKSTGDDQLQSIEQTRTV